MKLYVQSLSIPKLPYLKFFKRHKSNDLMRELPTNASRKLSK